MNIECDNPDCGCHGVIVDGYVCPHAPATSPEPEDDDMDQGGPIYHPTSPGGEPARFYCFQHGPNCEGNTAECITQIPCPMPTLADVIGLQKENADLRRQLQERDYALEAMAKSYEALKEQLRKV